MYALYVYALYVYALPVCLYLYACAQIQVTEAAWRVLSLISQPELSPQGWGGDAERRRVPLLFCVCVLSLSLSLSLSVSFSLPFSRFRARARARALWRALSPLISHSLFLALSAMYPCMHVFICMYEYAH